MVEVSGLPKRRKVMLAVVAPASHTGTWEAKAGRAPAQGKPGLHSKTLIQKTKQINEGRPGLSISVKVPLSLQVCRKNLPTVVRFTEALS